MLTTRLRVAFAILLFFCASAASAADVIILIGQGLCGTNVGGHEHTPDNHLSYAASVPPPFTVLRNDVAIATSNSDYGFDDISVVPGAVYTYVLTAQNGAVRSAAATVQTQVCDQLPGPLTLTLSEFCDSGHVPDRSGVHLSWTAVAGAGHYDVYGFGVLIASVTGTSYDDLSVKTPGNTYDYHVSAVTNLNGASLSKEVYITLSQHPCVLPMALTLSAAPAVCDMSPTTPVPTISLSWSAPPYATSYQILRDGAAVATSSGTAFADVVASGQNYGYTIRATNTFGSIDSNSVSVAVPATLCQFPPLGFAASSQSYCVVGALPAVFVAWTPAKTAASYSLYRDGARIVDALPPWVYDREDYVAAGKTYTYIVRASNSYGTTDATSVITVPANVCAPAATRAPLLYSTCERGAPVVHVGWGPVKYVTGYQVFRDGAAVFSTTLDQNAYTFDDRSVAAGQRYDYVIRSSNPQGSADSEVSSISISEDLCPLPAQPFRIAAQSRCDSTPTPTPAVTLDWIPPANGIDYTVYRNGAALAGHVEPDGTFIDIKAVAGESYTYFVLGTSASATYESNSVVVTVAKCPVVPPRRRSSRP
jgi:hypothetical protein